MRTVKLSESKSNKKRLARERKKLGCTKGESFHSKDMAQNFISPRRAQANTHPHVVADTWPVFSGVRSSYFTKIRSSRVMRTKALAIRKSRAFAEVSMHRLPSVSLAFSRGRVAALLAPRNLRAGLSPFHQVA